MAGVVNPLSNLRTTLVSPGRVHRRVWSADGRAHIEVRGLFHPNAANVADTVRRTLSNLPGVDWVELDVVLGRIVVAFDDDIVDLDDVIKVVDAVEQAHGAAVHRFPHDEPEHPADPELLRRHGATDAPTNVDKFLSACRRADRADAQRQLDDDPGLLERLTDTERAAIFHAAETGDTPAVALMLDLGFPLKTRGDDGGTPLHAAAYNGSAEIVRLLLDRGADIEARDTTWNDTPLGWAAVGSGEQPRTNKAADWVETVRTLLDEGAATDEITLSADAPKPPSPEVAQLFLAYGIGGQPATQSPL